MPSQLHEVLVTMFTDRPSLAVDLIAGPLGVPTLPFERAVLTSSNLTDIAPTEYRADAVVTLVEGDRTTWAVVVEIQLGRDPGKRRTWPAYVATLHARVGCPVFLLVLCPSARVAAWSAVPIVVSEPGLSLTPLVLGPDQVPAVVDPVVARHNPELSVLSAMAHGGRPHAEPVFDALLAGLSTVDRDHAQLYAEVVLRALPAAARTYLEALMSTTTDGLREDFARRFVNRGRVEGRIEGRTEGRVEGRAEGRVEGRVEGRIEGAATALLAVLEARQLDISVEIHDRIARCTDHDQLATWIRRAGTATTASDVFA